MKSSEFCGYVSGTIFSERPWSRIPSEPLCEFSFFFWFFCSSGSFFADRNRLFPLPALIRGMLTVNPEHRLTLSDVFQHPWCMRYPSFCYFRVFTLINKNNPRPSQLAKRSPLDLANKLTQPLRDNGDLRLAAPNLNPSE